MLVHPHPDPVAFAIFGFDVHWYGLMYLAGFIIAWIVGQRLLRYNSFAALRGIYLEDFVTASALGVVIGGRLGYVFFYNPSYYLQNPHEIIYLWEGGMSFHGGFLGVIIALFILAKIHALPLWAHEKNADPALQSVTSTKHTFLRLFDFAAVLTPPGLGLGRLANFINAELPGRIASADLPWAMVFGYPDNQPRHPSQLYQMFLEGFVLAALMMWLVRRPHPPGWLAGAFVTAYAVVRFLAEFFREPDSHLGFLAFNLSMGQLLSLPMLLIGLAMMYRLQLTRLWHADADRGRRSFKQMLHDLLYADAETYENARRLATQRKGGKRRQPVTAHATATAATTAADMPDDGGLPTTIDKFKTFLHNLLFEQKDEEEEKWEQHEKTVAETYGDDDDDTPRSFGQILKSIVFGVEESDDDDDDDQYQGRLTRRQKRRLKKKKKRKKRN